MVVGSSRKTSSRRVVDWIAASMEAVGVVTTSPEMVFNNGVLRARQGGDTSKIELGGARDGPVVGFGGSLILLVDAIDAIDVHLGRYVLRSHG